MTFGTLSSLSVDRQKLCADPTAQTAPSIKEETKRTQYQNLFWGFFRQQSSSFLIKDRTLDPHYEIWK
jgi:hypothetical protein